MTQPIKEFYKLREVASITGLSYSAIYALRHEIANRLPGSRTYLVHRSRIDTLTHNFSQNPVKSTPLSVQGTEIESCQFSCTPNRNSGTYKSPTRASNSFAARVGDLYVPECRFGVQEN